MQNNHSRIPERELRILIQVIEARSAFIIKKWSDTFGEISYYC